MISLCIINDTLQQVYYVNTLALLEHLLTPKELFTTGAGQQRVNRSTNSSPDYRVRLRICFMEKNRKRRIKKDNDIVRQSSIEELDCIYNNNR